MDGNYGVRGAARSCTEPHLEENKLGARVRAPPCARPCPVGWCACLGESTRDSMMSDDQNCSGVRTPNFLLRITRPRNLFPAR
jgi:hypothetical protein